MLFTACDYGILALVRKQPISCLLDHFDKVGEYREGAIIFSHFNKAAVALRHKQVPPLSEACRGGVPHQQVKFGCIHFLHTSPTHALSLTHTYDTRSPSLGALLRLGLSGISSSNTSGSETAIRSSWMDGVGIEAVDNAPLCIAISRL